VIGGALTSGLSWRWIFLVNVSIGIAVALMTLTRVGESRDPASRRPDWLGFISFTAALAFVVFGLIKSSERGFTDALVLGCFAAAAVLAAAFLVIEIVVAHPMLDLALFRKPTFTGGLLAAFGISATGFSMLLYLTLYLQDILGYSAIETGVRLLTMSGAILVCAAIAGRLSAHVPVRLLIGPGLLIVGVGLLLMRGLTEGSGWTHLVPGLVLAGVGAGMLNPPLASTAVGVVPPRQAGMASGINSTSRQVGIATGIALLGSLFASRAHEVVTGDLAQIPGLGGHAAQVGSAVTNGQLVNTLARLPAHQRAQVAAAAHDAFTTGLDRILLVAAVIALVAGALTLLLIRSRDFVSSEY
jgi:predicted MFS family arabinose efflux permease